MHISIYKLTDVLFRKPHTASKFLLDHATIIKLFFYCSSRRYCNITLALQHDHHSLSKLMVIHYFLYFSNLNIYSMLNKDQTIWMH